MAIIIINGVRYKDSLEKVLRTRLNSQDRKVNELGEIVFYPSVFGDILTNYENALKMKNNAYKTWLNNSLSSVFFELTSGEIVPLCLVKTLEFVAVPVIKRTSSLKGTYKLSSLLHKIKIMSPWTSANLFEVKIAYLDINHCGNIKTGNVYVGTKNNMVKGLRDLTIDHVQPMKQTLSKNQEDLLYISAISGLIYASGCKSDRAAVAKAILGKINYSDNSAYAGLKEEMDLILRETKGLRMIASSVNKL